VEWLDNGSWFLLSNLISTLPVRASSTNMHLSTGTLSGRSGLLGINPKERQAISARTLSSVSPHFITSDVIAAMSHRAHIGHRIEGAKHLT
jgi:hypothetical protein